MQADGRRHPRSERQRLDRDAEQVLRAGQGAPGRVEGVRIQDPERCGEEAALHPVQDPRIEPRVGSLGQLSSIVERVEVGKARLQTQQDRAIAPDDQASETQGDGKRTCSAREAAPSLQTPLLLCR